jgi:DNA-directed RNA polymerase subunit RPC12/RpoP
MKSAIAALSRMAVGVVQMPFAIRCSRCTKPLRVRDTARGHQVTCPSCRQIILVPASQPAQPEAETYDVHLEEDIQLSLSDETTTPSKKKRRKRAPEMLTSPSPVFQAHNCSLCEQHHEECLHLGEYYVVKEINSWSYQSGNVKTTETTYQVLNHTNLYACKLCMVQRQRWMAIICGPILCGVSLIMLIGLPISLLDRAQEMPAGEFGGHLVGIIVAVLLLICCAYMAKMYFALNWDNQGEVATLAQLSRSSSEGKLGEAHKKDVPWTERRRVYIWSAAKYERVRRNKPFG